MGLWGRALRQLTMRFSPRRHTKEAISMETHRQRPGIFEVYTALYCQTAGFRSPLAHDEWLAVAKQVKRAIMTSKSPSAIWRM